MSRSNLNVLFVMFDLVFLKFWKLKNAHHIVKKKKKSISIKHRYFHCLNHPFLWAKFVFSMLLPILINVMRLEFRKGLSRCRWKHIIVKCIAIIIKYESISKYIKTISNYTDSFPYGTASLKTYFLNPLLHNVCKIFKVCLTILRHCEVKG